MDSLGTELHEVMENRLKRAAMDRMRTVMEQKRLQEEAERHAQSLAEQEQAAQKAALMKQQMASVALIDICKQYVTEALTELRKRHYKGQEIPDTDTVDLAVERDAVNELSEKLTTAISLGYEDFSYLTPMRDQLSLSFNRAGIAMTKPVEKRTKETRRGKYDNYNDRETRRPLNEGETQDMYGNLVVAVGLAIKKIDEKQHGHVANKPRFTPTIPPKP